jgi:membrane protease subunit HflC
MRTFLIFVVAIGAIAVLLGSCLFAVDRTEFAYLTQFGKHVATYDGETDAGLHFKLPWPIQSVQRLDHRIQVFDLAPREELTHDPKGNTIDKTLTMSAYICWKIADADGVDRFVRTVGTPDRAEAILGPRINSRLGALIGNMKLDDLIGVVPKKQAEERMDRLSYRLRDQGSLEEESPGPQGSFRDAVRQSYGIDILDIRLRRFNYPAQVRDAIFERIRSERNKKVADYQSEGAQLAEDIKSQAEYEARTMLAEARATEQRLKGQAEATADRIRNDAHSKDVAFYTFLKKLSEYQRILGDNKTVLLLSSHRELFDALFKPPAPTNAPPAAKPANAGPVISQSTKLGGS